VKAGPKGTVTAPPLDLRRLPKRGGSRAVAFIERYVTVPKGTRARRRLRPRPYAIGWSSSTNSGRSCNAPKPTSIDQIYHFLLVSVNGTQVTVTPTDELGRVFDRQTYAF
jgi:hypothetical protein